MTWREIVVGTKCSPAREWVDADVDALVEDNLRFHEVCRGMIGEVYKRDCGEAQDLGRHKSMETTREAYSRLDAKEQRERLDQILRKSNESSY
jgi:hypothetical protein